MIVRIYDVNGYGDETLRADDVDLRECFPDGGDELYLAEGELARSGRCWIGGGAAPLVLLMRAP